MTARFGVSSEAFEAICSVFVGLEKIDRVRIFGSRALGTYKPGSDIDLAVEGRLITLDDLLSIRIKLDNLMLPYRFDLVDYKQLTDDAPLKEHIERVGVVVFSRVFGNR